MKTFVLREPEQARSMVAYVRAHAGDQARAGNPLVVSIEEYRARRTSDQNRKLHAILNDISEQAIVNDRQFEPEAWKEMVRRQFIGTEEIDMPDGSRIERGISTTTLSVAEFAELIERVQAWAAVELGVTL